MKFHADFFEPASKEKSYLLYSLNMQVCMNPTLCAVYECGSFIFK